jgi:PAS domain S-box-containing protein
MSLPVTPEGPPASPPPTQPEVVVDDILDEAPCGFVSFADDGTVRIVNTTLLSMVGYDREEVVGRRIEAMLTVGARIFYQTHFFPLLRLHGHAEEIFMLLRAKSGDDVAALVNAVRRERAGEWVTDCVLVRVSERQKYEDALLRARKAADEARAQADAHRRQVQEANELLERQAIELEFGQQQLLEQAEELEQQTEELQNLNDALQERTTELERQRELADDANRAKSSFLAMMSHELRTPLNAIGGYVQLLEMGINGPVTPAQLESLERIARSQRHLLRLINDVLNLARIEAGRVEYNLEDVRVGDIVDAVLPMVEPQYAARKLHLTVNVDRSIAAYADREKVQQILLNLLSNASKFTLPNGSVTIETAPRPADGAGLSALSVRDTGVGIPPDRLTHVFEPFVQVDDSHARRSEGTGLGLAISRDLARGMRGDLNVTSAVGVGSTFLLTLPGSRDQGVRVVEIR